ncbi:MAG: SpoIID/LytB domain-containing protein [Thermoanaerobacteraceae bacterium]
MRVKNILSFILIFSLVLTLVPLKDVKADVSIPKLIKIGLYYKDKAKVNYKLTSDSGFNFAYEDNTGNLIKMFSVGNNNISVLTDNNLYIKIGEYKDENNLKEGLKSVIMQLSGILPSALPNIFPGFDGIYHVYIGPYSSQAELNSAFLNISLKFPDSKIESQNKNILAIDNKEFLFLFNMPCELYVLKNNENQEFMGIEDKHYRGMFEFLRLDGSDMTAINVVPLEEYLYGVVPAEMPSSWNIEALKAQAVAARTYAAKNIGRYGKFGFDLTNDEYSQVYKGYDGENSTTNIAVDTTKGIVAIYQGNLIDALFHSHSGGYTEDNINYFSGDLPYLKGVKDEYVFGYSLPNDSWVVTYTKDQIRNKLKTDIGDITDIKVTEKSWTGRAVAVTIYGTNGTYILKKGNIRDFFGTKSTMFTITGNGTNTSEDLYVISEFSNTKKVSIKDINIISASKTSTISNDKVYVLGVDSVKNISQSSQPSSIYTLTGSGFGHGIGLSQYGARGLADHGYNYIEILKYYYNGIDIYDTINNKIL